MAWIVRLASIGAGGEEHGSDVMRIARPDGLADPAAPGLSLAEGKRLLAGVQREIVAAQARLHAAAWFETGSQVRLGWRCRDG